MVMFAVCIIQLCRITPHIHTWWRAMEGKGHFFSHSHSVTSHGWRRDISPPWFVVKCECVFSSENSKLKDLVFNFNPPPVILFLGCGGSRLLRWMGWYDSSMQKGVIWFRVRESNANANASGAFLLKLFQDCNAEIIFPQLPRGPTSASPSSKRSMPGGTGGCSWGLKQILENRSVKCTNKLNCY